MNIGGILEQHARDRATHPAIESGAQTISYEQLLGYLISVEANLRDAGVRPGQVVTIIHEESVTHIVLMLALARLGAVIHAISNAEPESEKARALGGLGVRHIIAAGKTWRLPGTRLIDSSSLLRDNPKAVAVFASMFDGRRPLIVVQSSGTTGPPKRALLSHDDMRARILGHEHAVGIDSSDRYLNLLRIDYFAERRRCLAALYLGGTVVCSPEWTPSKLAAEVSDRRITWMALVPAQVRRLLSEWSGSAPMFPSLKRMYVSSSWMSPDERVRARKRLCPNLVERYATNESGLAAIAYPQDQDDFPDSVGRVIDSIEAQIVDADGRPLPPGSVGQLRYRAPYIPKRYLNNPEATAKAFQDGWYYPGDIAVVNEQGYLFLKGRTDDVINHGGDKVYPIEIESALIDHPAVSEAAVVGWPDDEVGEVPVAFVVVAGRASKKDLANYCANRVARHKVPHRFEFVDELPKNAIGKVVKADLRRPSTNPLRRANNETA